MDKSTALNILIEAIKVATKRGAFELFETEGILLAVKMFTTPPENAQNAPGDVLDDKTESTIKSKK